jgi:hypothetical protein
LFGINDRAGLGASRNRDPHVEKRILGIDGVVTIMADHMVAARSQPNAGIEIGAQRVEPGFVEREPLPRCPAVVRHVRSKPLPVNRAETKNR